MSFQNINDKRDAILLTKPNEGKVIMQDILYEIFKNLSIKELLNVYLTGNADFINVLENYTFDFYDEPIPKKMSIKQFRNIFKSTKGLNISNRQNITDKDFEFIRPIPSTKIAGFRLNMNYCKQITDAAFIHLKGIHTLNLRGCNQITDSAFVHLDGIKELDIGDCNQITDAAFVYLKGIHRLDMWGCSKITDAAFVNLKGIHTLKMNGCDQITDAAFVHIEGIKNLNMRSCHQITDAAFVHLKGIHNLNIMYCKQITDDAFVHLKGIKKLDMSYCIQDTITHKGLRNLAGIERLVIDEDFLDITKFLKLNAIDSCFVANY